jgi:hypothetical protein
MKIKNMKKSHKIAFLLAGIYFLIGMALAAFVLMQPNGSVYYSYPMEIILHVIAWPLWMNSFLTCGDFGCLQIN